MAAGERHNQLECITAAECRTKHDQYPQPGWGGQLIQAIASVNVTYQPLGITLSPTALSAVAFGAAYSQSLTAAGGAPPYSFAITSGDLPDGLYLSGTGSISGSPSAAGTSTFTVTATDSTGDAGSQAYTGRALEPGLCVRSRVS